MAACIASRAVTPHEADPLVLAGPTLVLRYPRAADAPRLFELGSDPAVTRFFSWGPYERVEQPEAYIATLPRKRETAEALDFAIEHREAGVIGITGLSEVVRRDRRAVVGTWVGTVGFRVYSDPALLARSRPIHPCAVCLVTP